ncbi:hypothetical protein [Bacillus infantis]|uniref:beta barrel domain-containing protein n=1 Tax=Bacillus infantis TaxID=324767 RepID=UPI003CEF551B
MENTFEAGQTVYGKPGVNTARYNKAIQVGKIEKVGRKYLEVSFGGYNKYKYYKEDLKQVTEYATDYYLYLSKQDILDEEESELLVNDFRKMFGGYGKVDLTLDQLRRIKEIVSE